MSNKHDLPPLLTVAERISILSDLNGNLSGFTGWSWDDVVQATERVVRARFTEHIQRLEAENEALKKEASDAATALPQAVRNERERWEAAVRAACKLIDPLHPAGQPGSYARGFDVGVETALRTLREVLDAAMAKEQKE